MRGDGAKLVNTENDVFLSDYDKRAELAPRDIVARAIYDQYFKQKQNVFLSFAGVRVTDAVRTKYQNLYNLIHSSGYDLFRDRIPVFPAAHYTIGGVQTDLNGATTIRGLYAVGEVASSGVHGANRLASNSLLECLVFARKAVADAGNRSNIGYLPDNIETGTPDHIIDAKIIHEIRCTWITAQALSVSIILFPKPTSVSWKCLTRFMAILLSNSLAYSHNYHPQCHAKNALTRGTLPLRLSQSSGKL